MRKNFKASASGAGLIGSDGYHCLVALISLTIISTVSIVLGVGLALIS
jgi:hypothetical protein